MSNAPRLSGARRDWGSDPEGCTILHVDLDAFFASVETRDNPALVGRPVIVGGDHRAVVVAATYEARAFGVRAGMPVGQARALCPQATVVPPRHERYRAVSHQVMEILAQITDRMEQVSVDEAYLDLAGASRLWKHPIDVGEAIRARVAAECDLTCSVGIGTSKLVAKLASTQAKPDGLMMVPRAAQIEFLHMLPVAALGGVGPKTAEKLRGWGIDSVADLAGTPVDVLQARLGKMGRQLHALAWANDPRPVTPTREAKSIGVERTFADDLTRPTDIDAALVALADRAAAQARHHEVCGKTVVLKARSAQFETVTRSVTLPQPSNQVDTVVAAVRHLWDGVARTVGPVRLLGVRLEGLVDASQVDVQGTLDIFGEVTARPGAGVRSQVTADGLDPHTVDVRQRAVDGIREKFGWSAISLGAGLAGGQNARPLGRDRPGE